MRSNQPYLSLSVGQQVLPQGRDVVKQLLAARLVVSPVDVLQLLVLVLVDPSNALLLAH